MMAVATRNFGPLGVAATLLWPPAFVVLLWL